MSLITVPLTAAHNRNDFTCGQPLLDDYLRKQARQDVRRRLSACFVWPGENAGIKGYYTLSGASIERKQLPEEWMKKMPPAYTELPVILLGRLAVAASYQGQGLGESILMDALKRSSSVSSELGSMAVVVDPLDAAAERFYARYDFIRLPDSGKLFLPMAVINRLFPMAR